MAELGGWAFIAGAVIAVLAGAFSGAVGYGGAITLLLVVLGLVVGFLNIKPKEVQTFIIASVGLMVAGSANVTVIDSVIRGLGTVLQSILENIMVFIAPAVIIVGLRTVYSLSKD